MLVVRFKSNKPLLLDLMAATGIEPEVTLRGRPKIQTPGKPSAGDRISLVEYLESFAMAVRVPSGDLVALSKVQFIRA